MTTEEKAKRYDEAIKVAESIHRVSSDLAEIKRMEDLFPELKESEDEKVRKALIYLVNGFQDDIIVGINKQDYLDWLEKQGEQKPTWKPSDEQIASITCAVRKMKESACYDSELVSLYQDLKKLREK